MKPITPWGESCSVRKLRFQLAVVARTKPKSSYLGPAGQTMRAGASRSVLRRNEASASARHHLVHLHDRFDLRVVGDVAHDLCAMLGERVF